MGNFTPTPSAPTPLRTLCNKRSFVHSWTLFLESAETPFLSAEILKKILNLGVKSPRLCGQNLPLIVFSPFRCSASFRIFRAEFRCGILTFQGSFVLQRCRPNTQELSGDPNPQYSHRRRTAFLQGLEVRKVQRYKWRAYCHTKWRCTAVLSPRPAGAGVSETLLKYRKTNHHPCLSRSFTTHGLLHPPALPDAFLSVFFFFSRLESSTTRVQHLPRVR